MSDQIESMVQMIHCSHWTVYTKQTICWDPTKTEKHWECLLGQLRIKTDLEFHGELQVLEDWKLRLSTIFTKSWRLSNPDTMFLWTKISYTVSSWIVLGKVYFALRSKCNTIKASHTQESQMKMTTFAFSSFSLFRLWSVRFLNFQDMSYPFLKRSISPFPKSLE